MPKIVRVVIVDDDESSRFLLDAMLVKLYSGVLEVVGKAGSVAEALELNEKVHPDLIFLDIEMPDGTGFDFLEKANYKDFRLIITSAHDSYALKAFKVNAEDYLLKPFSPDELKIAVDKSIVSPIYANAGPEFKLLIDYVNGNRSRISLPTLNGFEFVAIQDILRCEASGNYTKFYLRDKNHYLVAKTLKVYDDLLKPDGFIRIHASHLVNLREVRSYSKGEGGYVIMSDGTEIEVSRSRKDEFLSKLRT